LRLAGSYSRAIICRESHSGDEAAVKAKSDHQSGHQAQSSQAPLSPWLASLFAQGLTLHQRGQLKDAERIYNQILATRPDHFDSRHLLGVVFLQSGNFAEAVVQIDLALKRNRHNVHALSNRGAALKELGRLDEAMASYDRLLKTAPDYAEGHSNRGVVLHALRRYQDALASYDHALTMRPDYVDALCSRAATLHELGRFEEAVASCDVALALNTNVAETHSNRANSLLALNRFEEALASCDRALALRPDYAEAHSNRGNALRELHRTEEALNAYDRAIALQPQFAEAWSNRGNTLQELRRYDEALASYDHSLRLRPDYAETHANRGNVLKELGRFDDALASYDRAAVLQPSLAEGHFNAAICRLMLGDFERGWQQHEARWDTAQLRAVKRSFPQPQWRGTDDLAGKTMLLHHEQGLGDTLQFCRYVPLVAERAGSVIFEVPKALQTLMQSLPGPIQVIARGDPLPDFDVHSPLLSLPLACGTRLETIPSQVPYLSPPAGKREAWHNLLGAHDTLRVGLVWAGDPRKQTPGAHRIDRQRSLTFDQLAPIFEVRDCEFYSLQKGSDAVEQLHNSPLRDRVIDWSDDFHDFSDTAALIDNLDLVIAVDTSVLHVAGALGKPVWLINRYNTCWRWLLDRDDSPWYPSLRQFRQDSTRRWDPVIARIATSLHDHAVAFRNRA
jgi:tetratricopeptide (TPR) repeat protein